MTATGSTRPSQAIAVPVRPLLNPTGPQRDGAQADPDPVSLPRPVERADVLRDLLQRCTI